MQYECTCTGTVHATIVLYYAVVANTTIDLKIFMMVIVVDCGDGRLPRSYQVRTVLQSQLRILP